MAPERCLQCAASRLGTKGLCYWQQELLLERIQGQEVGSGGGVPVRLFLSLARVLCCLTQRLQLLCARHCLTGTSVSLGRGVFQEPLEK